MTNTRFGFGLIGSGLMGRTLAFAIRELVPEACVAAVYGGRGAPALARADRIDEATSLADLLARQDVDAVLIASPTFNHAEQVIAAANAGKHVFCEAPLAATLPEIDAMTGACRAADVTLGVEAVSRCRTGIRLAHELLASGAIGDVRMIRFTNAHPLGGHHGSAGWLGDPRAGSPFVDQGAHSNDVLCWFAGADAVDCYARYASYSPDPPAAQSAMVTFGFANGAMAQSWVSDEFPGALGPRTSEYLVVGSSGMLEVQLRGTLRVHGKGGWRTEYVHPEISLEPPTTEFVYPYGDQLRDFIVAIDKRRDPEVSGVVARRAIEMGLAADRSAATGEAVKLPLAMGIAR